MQMKNLTNTVVATGTAETTGIKYLNPTVSTETTVGKNYLTTETLFKDLHDLVNEDFKLWYYKMFYRLGLERTLRYASIARNDAKKDRRKYFSWLLKYGK